MDLGIIIAIVGTAMAMIGVVISMMYWVRSESNSLREDSKEDRKNFLQLNRNIEILVGAMGQEMRDFHNRLVEIEKKNSCQQTRISRKFKEALKEIQTIRVEKKLDEVKKSLREITSLILKHDSWARMRRDIINYKGGFHGD